MSRETLEEKIFNDLTAIVHDTPYQRYVHHLTTSGDHHEISSARAVVDAARSEFVAGNQGLLEDLCQSGDWNAIAYCGYDEATNEMRFWPDDERAQVVYLAGFAALMGKAIRLKDIMYIIN